MKTDNLFLPLLLCFSWMIGNVEGDDSGGSLRSGNPSAINNKDETMLDELKGIVSKFDDRIHILEENIKSKNDIIDDLRIKVSELETECRSSSSFHRLLQSAKKDDIDYCMPKYVQTTRGGRCDFLSVTRFQDKTFFNDDVVFNENVEFNPDANCMPTYNKTTKMCRFNNNITFDEGNIFFKSKGNYSVVEFDNNKTKFDGHDVEFRDHTSVRFESDVSFNNRGQVNFNKETKFSEDVTISSTDHDIDFKVEDQVKVSFDVTSDHYIEFDGYPKFYKDVKFEKNIEVKGEARVRKKTKLDDVELYGYLWVDGKSYLEGEVEVKSDVMIHDGNLNVTNGDLDVQGRITTDHVVIDGKRNKDKYNDDDHDDNNFINPGPPANLLTVKGGNVDIDGTLTADRIRSNDINLIDINKIIKETEAKFRDGTLDMKVNSVESNSGIIGGTPFPLYDEIVTDKVIELLENKDLKLNNLVARQATIGGQFYPKKDDKVTLKEIVKELMTYPDVVTIPKLKSIELDVIPTILTENGIMREVQGEMKLNGDHVATIKDLQKVESEINRSSDPITTDDVVSALKGADIKVSSIEASSVMTIQNRDGVPIDVATVDDVYVTVSDAINSDRSSQDVSCTCERSDIEDVVTSEYVREIIDAEYISSVVPQYILSPPDKSSCSCSESDIRDAIDSDYIHDLGFVSKNDDNTVCTCSEEFVRETITFDFIEEMGFSTSSGDGGGGGECTCNIYDHEDDIKGIINTSYISDLGFASTNGITDIVNSDYISSICPCGGGYQYDDDNNYIDLVDIDDDDDYSVSDWGK